jgi:hypothetical protein
MNYFSEIWKSVFDFLDRRKGTSSKLCLKGNSNLDHFLVTSVMLGGYR